MSKLNLATGAMTIVAGDGTGGVGGAAIDAKFAYPIGVAVDNAGNVFILDSAGPAAVENRVYRVDVTTGLLSLVAGNGTSGYSGDSGPAVNAQLNWVRLFSDGVI